jgi:hypothetical protein
MRDTGFGKYQNVVWVRTSRSSIGFDVDNGRKVKRGADGGMDGWRRYSDYLSDYFYEFTPDYFTMKYRKVTDQLFQRKKSWRFE